ncbi:hypothetical protein B0H14DRAFT_1494088 [Mycena olivaceomarginata]|nr:hypothetical protein B0H14DRAFT_1494088 [Mycena olivaceomarginata]
MASEKSLSLMTPFSESLAAMATARDEVISTPELLEHTLAHLPMRDLLTVAPLVSKTWLAITISPALQRALFFQPDRTGTHPVENPLLVELFPPFFLLPSGAALVVAGRCFSLQGDVVGHSTRCIQAGGGRRLAPHAGYSAPDANNGRHTHDPQYDRGLRAAGRAEGFVPADECTLRHRDAFR